MEERQSIAESGLVVDVDLVETVVVIVPLQPPLLKGRDLLCRQTPVVQSDVLVLVAQLFGHLVLFSHDFVLLPQIPVLEGQLLYLLVVVIQLSPTVIGPVDVPLDVLVVPHHYLLPQPVQVLLVLLFQLKELLSEFGCVLFQTRHGQSQLVYPVDLRYPLAQQPLGSHECFHQHHPELVDVCVFWVEHDVSFQVKLLVLGFHLLLVTFLGILLPLMEYVELFVQVDKQLSYVLQLLRLASTKSLELELNHRVPIGLAVYLVMDNLEFLLKLGHRLLDVNTDCQLLEHIIDYGREICVLGDSFYSIGIVLPLVPVPLTHGLVPDHVHKDLMGFLEPLSLLVLLENDHILLMVNSVKLVDLPIPDCSLLVQHQDVLGLTLLKLLELLVLLPQPPVEFHPLGLELSQLVLQHSYLVFLSIDHPLQLLLFFLLFHVLSQLLLQSFLLDSECLDGVGTILFRPGTHDVLLQDLLLVLQSPDSDRILFLQSLNQLVLENDLTVREVLQQAFPVTDVLLNLAQLVMGISLELAQLVPLFFYLLILQLLINRVLSLGTEARVREFILPGFHFGGSLDAGEFSLQVLQLPELGKQDLYIPLGVSHDLDQLPLKPTVVSLLLRELGLKQSISGSVLVDHRSIDVLEVYGCCIAVLLDVQLVKVPLPLVRQVLDLQLVELRVLALYSGLQHVHFPGILVHHALVLAVIPLLPAQFGLESFPVPALVTLDYTLQLEDLCLLVLNKSGYWVSVYHRLVLDVHSPRGVLEGVDCLFKAVARRAHTSDHLSVGVTTQGVLENPGQFGVTVGNKLLLRVCKGVDNIPQMQQPHVDVDSLIHGLPSGSGLLESLGSGQVHKVKLGPYLLLLSYFFSFRVLFYPDGKDGMRPRRDIVHASGRCTPLEVAPRQEVHHVVPGQRSLLDSAAYADTLVLVLPDAQTHLCPVYKWRQQVIDRLVVDLDETSLYNDIPLSTVLVNMTKDVADNLGDQPKTISTRRSHRVSFPACVTKIVLPVCPQARRVALQPSKQPLMRSLH